MTNVSTQLPAEAQDQMNLFRRSLPLQMRLQETLRFLGSSGGLTCLDIGFDNGIISHYLRRRGGTWHTMVTGEQAAEACRQVVKDNVYVLDGPTLPFKKQTFDVVVLSGVLERVRDDEGFIEECHRVMKPDSRLIVNVAHVKRFTPINSMRRMYGMSYEQLGWARPGYSDLQLFSVLKHGFDVHQVRSYSRFFAESTDMLFRVMSRRTSGAASDSREHKRLANFYMFANVFLWISFQLDFFIFFSKGHHLIAHAKRRAWRPRNAPVLVDGRSISEAVLSKAAD